MKGDGVKPVRNHVGALDFRTYGNEVGLLETKAVSYKMAMENSKKN